MGPEKAKNWNASYRTGHVGGKEAGDDSLALDIPNDAFQFPRGQLLQPLADHRPWAQTIDNQGAVLQDINILRAISKTIDYFTS